MPIGALVGSWAKPPQPIDFVLNIALYVPLGVFGALSSPRSQRPWRGVAIVTAGGALLSIAIELAQYFDAARYTAASDVYANVLGTFLGAAAAVAAVPPVIVVRDPTAWRANYLRPASRSLLSLGPAVAQPDRPVEDEPARRRIRVAAEIPLPFELHGLVRIIRGQCRLDHRPVQHLE